MTPCTALIASSISGTWRFSQRRAAYPLVMMAANGCLISCAIDAVIGWPQKQKRGCRDAAYQGMNIERVYFAMQ